MLGPRTATPSYNGSSELVKPQSVLHVSLGSQRIGDAFFALFRNPGVRIDDKRLIAVEKNFTDQLLVLGVDHVVGRVLRSGLRARM